LFSDVVVKLRVTAEVEYSGERADDVYDEAAVKGTSAEVLSLRSITSAFAGGVLTSDDADPSGPPLLTKPAVAGKWCRCNRVQRLFSIKQ
jgi:hypothetical protein